MEVELNTTSELSDGLNAIYNYGVNDGEQMYAFAESVGIKFNPLEPPYLTQAKIAKYLLKFAV